LTAVFVKLLPLYKELYKHVRNLVLNRDKSKKPGAALLKKPESKVAKFACFNSPDVSWEEATENVRQAVESRVLLNGLCPFHGPLDSTQLLAAMAQLEEDSLTNVEDIIHAVGVCEKVPPLDHFSFHASRYHLSKFCHSICVTIWGLPCSIIVCSLSSFTNLSCCYNVMICPFTYPSLQVRSQPDTLLSVSSQLCIACPVMRLQKGDKICLVNLHRLLNQEEVLAGFIDGLHDEVISGPPEPSTNDVLSTLQADVMMRCRQATATMADVIIRILDYAAKKHDNFPVRGCAANALHTWRQNTLRFPTPVRIEPAKAKAKRGRPSLHSLFPDLKKTVKTFLEQHGWGAQTKRRDSTCDSVGVELSDLRKHLNEKV